MANCAPCLKLGLQLVAHYPANRAAGKDAECYYHHFGMPLPASIQAKIAQPKPVAPIDDGTIQKMEQAQTDRSDRDDAKERGLDIDEVKKEAAAKKKPDLRTKGEQPRSTGSRAGLTPDVCEECWHYGHACPAHCTVGEQRLCIDCADGKPCAIAREKAANPRTPAHERYHVKLPGVKKPRAADVALVSDERGIVARVERTAAPQQPTKKINMSLVLDNKELPTRAVSRPAKPAPVQTPDAEMQQEEKKETVLVPQPIAPANGKDYTLPPPPKEEVPANGTATIIVTEKHMDAFWAKLSLPEKAAIFQRQLEGA
jgi:hypothetical protein